MVVGFLMCLLVNKLFLVFEEFLSELLEGIVGFFNGIVEI